MINYPFLPFYRTPYNRYHYYKNNFYNKFIFNHKNKKNLNNTIFTKNVLKIGDVYELSTNFSKIYANYVLCCIIPQCVLLYRFTKK